MRKKLKQPSFARGVNRDDVTEGAEQLGVDLDEHIAFVIAALRPIAGRAGPARLVGSVSRAPPTRRSTSSSLVHAPTETRIQGVSGM